MEDQMIVSVSRTSSSFSVAISSALPESSSSESTSSVPMLGGGVFPCLGEATAAAAAVLVVAVVAVLVVLAVVAVVAVVAVTDNAVCVVGD